MKTFTKLNFLALLAVLLFAFSGCEEEGPMGPAGPKGETGEGAPGPQGEKGDTGGFTFKEFKFEQITIPAGYGIDGTTTLDFEVSKEEFEKSLTMFYVSAGTNNANWLVMPGIGTGGQHEYRVWYAFPQDNTISRAILRRVAGPENQSQTYLQARIIVIPLETVGQMQAAGINMDDKRAVRAALKLK